MQSLFHQKIEIDLSIESLSRYVPFEIKHIKQCKSNWCWAAVGAMIRNFVFGKKEQISQFDFVRYRRPTMHGNDCNEDDSNEYDDPFMPKPFLKLLDDKKVPLKTFCYSDDIESICTVAVNSPILLGITFNKKNTDGHYEIISGYDNFLNLLYINNPSRNNLGLFIPDEFIENHFDTGMSSAEGLFNSKLD